MKIYKIKYSISDVVSIVAIVLKVELVITNELAQSPSHEAFAAFFAAGMVFLRKCNEGSLSEIVNVGIEGQNRPRFVLVVSQEAEFLGEILVDNHGLRKNDFLFVTEKYRFISWSKKYIVQSKENVHALYTSPAADVTFR